MRLPLPFVRLPWNFDAERLAADVKALPESAWMSHPSRLRGNSALALISKDGGNNDDFTGRMQPSPYLAQCEYLQRVVASFGVPISRSRLMRLDAHSEVATHVDFNYHWHSRVRIHVPIVTNPGVTFYCGDQQLHMAAGESWIFDNWRRHRVVNDSDETRVHLVVDTTGSAEFWEAAKRMQSIEPSQWSQHTERASEARLSLPLRCEQQSMPPVMDPSEMKMLSDEIIADFTANQGNDPDLVRRYTDLLITLCDGWQQACSTTTDDTCQRARLQSLIDAATESLHPDRRALLTSSNRIGVNPVIVQRILRAALTPET